MVFIVNELQQYKLLEIAKEIGKMGLLKNLLTKNLQWMKKSGDGDGIYYDYKQRPILLEVKSGNFQRKNIGRRRERRIRIRGVVIFTDLKLYRMQRKFEMDCQLYFRLHIINIFQL